MNANLLAAALRYRPKKESQFVPDKVPLTPLASQTPPVARVVQAILKVKTSTASSYIAKALFYAKFPKLHDTSQSLNQLTANAPLLTVPTSQPQNSKMRLICHYY